MILVFGKSKYLIELAKIEAIQALEEMIVSALDDEQFSEFTQRAGRIAELKVILGKS